MLDTPLIESIGWALVHFIWQGTLIGAVTALALLLIAPARLRCAVSCIALTCMLVAPISSVVVDVVAPAPVSSASTLTQVLVPPHALDDSSRQSLDVNRVLPLAVLGWMAGVLVLSIRLVMATIGATRLAHATRDVGESVASRARLLAQRLGVATSVRVVESAGVESPTVIGWLRPIILLPASALTAIPVSHLDAVLVHELAHVRRHDFLVNVLQAIVETVLFYHPAVWWCSRQIRIEREHCCDDLVVDLCGDRVAYAKALAALEEQRGLRPVLSLNASGGRLVDRIRRILNPRPIEDARSPAWSTVVVLSALVTIIAVTPVLRFGDPVSAQEPPILEPVEPPQVPLPPRAPRPLAPRSIPSAPELPAPPSSPTPVDPMPPPAIDDLVAAFEAALEEIALRTGGLPPDAVAPPPPPPRPPVASPPSPAVPQTAPEPPTPPQAPTAPPASPAPPAPLAPPAPAAPPAPPAPPQVDLTVPSEQQVDAIRQMADQLNQTAQMLLRQSGELRRAEQQLQLRRMELMAKEKELATLRDRTLEQQAVLQEMHKAVAESFAKAEAFRAIEPDANRLREQVEALRKQVEKLRAR